MGRNKGREKGMCLVLMHRTLSSETCICDFPPSGK